MSNLLLSPDTKSEVINVDLATVPKSFFQKTELPDGSEYLGVVASTTTRRLWVYLQKEQRRLAKLVNQLTPGDPAAIKSPEKRSRVQAEIEVMQSRMKALETEFDRRLKAELPQFSPGRDVAYVLPRWEVYTCRMN
ncbi:MAG: hypothetical protein A2589_00765 [Candidatus Vogelbacteria bacterium RIFOXYD1_FULL_46_19]|uniref:Uncharacterized protein n=1 Tax=Candidatus Vogelbacteria bacterium RIFOXYD1_FULL_46_19 TaxID=1802439 RepID=A0A1G2QFP5_9BACT|nr:MAG: hypothetical protein A2589_00765 [Candidatus Vogelbacteria bacterium RIFOXYD1_FULL_46_19]